MKCRKLKIDGFYLGRFDYDSEAVAEIKKFAVDSKINSGFFTIIGAVKEAVISFYDQEEKKYFSKELKQHMEIVSCTGNMATKDEKIVVHAHACFSLPDGSTVGGHLVSMRIFAGELHFFPSKDKVERKFDETTGLNLMDL